MSEETKTMFKKIGEKMDNDHEKIIVMQQDINYTRKEVAEVKIIIKEHCAKNEQQFDELKVLIRGISAEARTVAKELAEEKASEVLETRGKLLFASKETQDTVDGMKKWFFKTGVTLIIMMGGIIAILIYSLVLNNKNI